MGDFFGYLLELLTSNRWIRYGLGGLIYAGTIWNADFSTALPWIVLAVNTIWLVGHEIADRRRKR